MMARVAFALLRNATTVAIFLVLESTASGTTFVLDHFTASANTLLENHTPDVGGAWTRGTGSSGLTLIAANDNLRNVAAGDWNTYTNPTTPVNNEYVVTVKVTFTNANANNFIDLFGRI